MLSKKVYQLCRMKHFLNLHARKLFLHGHILSSISYASTLYDTASANSLKPLLSVYKRAIKSVLLKPSRLNKNDYYSLVRSFASERNACCEQRDPDAKNHAKIIDSNTYNKILLQRKRLF